MAYLKIPNAPLFLEQIHQAAHLLGLTLSDAQATGLLNYLDKLLFWTKAYNLTAITEPQEALIKHIIDCMAIVPKLPFADQTGVRLLDIGTGAGLPAVVIAILKPNWQVVALDSNNKKIRFIRQMVSELALTNLTPVASRIQNFDGTFEVITSRAFASLGDFVQVAAPYLAEGGVLYAMKGKAPNDGELQALGQWHIAVQMVNVPQLSDDRCVVCLKYNKGE
ncbi:MAG: 16S rRNA (guanine(527)-N(7))-methyltransferase RsmG [Moraxella sp.]|nr:16S rRNA (guanine(527)-N(7))-methyltransferase RsmG [Moraxella sp.]